METVRIRPRRIEPAGDVGSREAERRALNHALDLFIALRMLLEEHRLEQVGEWDIEAVEPVGGLIAIVPVSMPAPAGGEDHVSGFHRHLLAVDGGESALAVDDDAQRVRGVAMRG